MENSNIEEPTISKKLEDKREDDKENFENQDTLEPFAMKETVISPLKRKSNISVGDETKRKRSTDCTWKEECGDNLDRLKNVKDYVSIIGHSEKSQEISTSAIEVPIIDDNFLNKVDGISFLKDIDDLGNLKTGESKHNVTKDQTTAKYKNIEPRSSKVNNSIKGQSRLVEHFQTKNPDTDAKRHSLSQEFDGASQKCEKLLLQESQILSPGKRKSELIEEDEAKRRRKEYEENNLFSNINVSDTVLSFQNFKESSEILGTSAFTGGIKKEIPETQDEMIKSVVEAITKERNKQSRIKKKIKVFDKQPSELPSISESFAEFEELAAGMGITDRKSLSFKKVLQACNQPNSGLFNERYSDYSNAISLDSSDRVISAEIAHHQNMFSSAENEIDSNKSDTEMENSKERLPCKTEKMFKYPRTSKNKNQISKNTEDKNLPLQEIPHSSLNEETCSRFNPQSSSRQTGKNVHPLYLESESKFVPVEQYKNDPEIVESQKKILESIVQKATAKQKPILEQKRGPKNDLTAKRKFLERVIGNSNALRIFLESHAMTLVLYLFKTYREAFEDTAELETFLQDISAIFLEYIWQATSTIRKIGMLRNNASSSEFRENEGIVDSIEKNYDFGKKSPKSLPDADEKNSPKSLPPDDENNNFPDFVCNEKNPVSPISSPSKNEIRIISEVKYPIFREYPGLAEEPDKVKKDARYQKKFYRQKPVKLPINWNTGSTSDEPCIDSGDNRIQNDPRTLRKQGDRKHEDGEGKFRIDDQAHEDQESNNNSSSETLQQIDGYKTCSFMDESPTSPTGSSKSKNFDSPEEK